MQIYKLRYTCKSKLNYLGDFSSFCILLWLSTSYIYYDCLLYKWMCQELYNLHMVCLLQGTVTVGSVCWGKYSLLHLCKLNMFMEEKEGKTHSIHWRNVNSVSPRDGELLPEAEFLHEIPLSKLFLYNSLTNHKHSKIMSHNFKIMKLT